MLSSTPARDAIGSSGLEFSIRSHSAAYSLTPSSSSSSSSSASSSLLYLLRALYAPLSFSLRGVSLCAHLSTLLPPLYTNRCTYSRWIRRAGSCAFCGVPKTSSAAAPFPTFSTSSAPLSC